MYTKVPMASIVRPDSCLIGGVKCGGAGPVGDGCLCNHRCSGGITVKSRCVSGIGAKIKFCVH